MIIMRDFSIKQRLKNTDRNQKLKTRRTLVNVPLQSQKGLKSFAKFVKRRHGILENSGFPPRSFLILPVQNLTAEIIQFGFLWSLINSKIFTSILRRIKSSEGRVRLCVIYLLAFCFPWFSVMYFQGRRWTNLASDSCKLLKNKVSYYSHLTIFFFYKIGNYWKPIFGTWLKIGNSLGVTWCTETTIMIIRVWIL